MSNLVAAELAAIIFLAYTTQAVAGFGSTVVAITLAALIMPVPYVMPIAVALNLPFCGWLIWRHAQQIQWPMLLQRVLPLMLLGVLVGAFLAWQLSGLALRRPLGALVLFCSLLDLWRLHRRHEHRPQPALRLLLLLGSGLAQGFSAMGGPLLAAALAGSGLPRQQLRASLSVVWLISNSLLTLGYVCTQRYSLAMAQTTVALLPVMALALALGEWVHQRINERQFRLVVDLVLLFSALALLR